MVNKEKARHAIFQKDMPENYWYDIYRGGQRYSKMYRLKRYRYTIFEKKIN